MIAQRRVYLLVNGILTRPGNWKNWNLRAITWIHAIAPEHHHAEAIEYFSDALVLRTLDEGERVDALRRKIRDYAGWEIVLVGHSNGCAVITDALKNFPEARIHSMHLFSGASEADWIKNGFNKLQASGRVGKIWVYIAGRDWALKLAHTVLAKICGYGVLGLHGPQNVRNWHQVQVIREPTFGHGTWFEDEPWPSPWWHTMERIVGHAV